MRIQETMIQCAAQTQVMAIWQNSAADSDEPSRQSRSLPSISSHDLQHRPYFADLVSERPQADSTARRAREDVIKAVMISTTSSSLCDVGISDGEEEEEARSELL